MNYLFFDIECCNCKDICEFGYVLVDENLDVLDKKFILINPKEIFDLVGRDDRRDLYLFYSEQEYYNSPTFDTFYDEIKEMIESPNNTVIGFSTADDVKFLKRACRRINKEPINFSYYDVQKIYGSVYSDEKKQTSLENAIKSLNIDIDNLNPHKSDDDAHMTFLLLKEMVKEKNMNINSFLNLSEIKKYNSSDVIYIKDDIKKLFKDPNSLNDDKIKEVVKYCSDHIEKPNIIKNTSFLDKTICFSNLYETKNPKEFVVLSLYIVNNGGRVIGRVTSSNYYIKHVDDEIDVNSIRYKVAIKQLANEKIQIMSYDDLLSILNLTNEQVLNTTYDEYRYKLQRRQNKQKKHKGLCVELKQYLNDDLLNDTEDE